MAYEFRRFYAFEAEGVSEEVKAELKSVEDTADTTCATPEDCDKVLSNIDQTKEKVNDALKSMSDSAKDCKDGKCSKEEMAADIKPELVNLKEVAKTLGVATESDEVTAEDLKNTKDFLEGAEEIIEAKKDELGAGSGGKSGKNSVDDDDDAPATEGILIGDRYISLSNRVAIELACEAYCNAIDAEDARMDMNAMEGANHDFAKKAREIMGRAKVAMKSAKAAARAGNYAEAKSRMETAIKAAEEGKAELENINNNEMNRVSAAVFGYFARNFRWMGLQLLGYITVIGFPIVVVASIIREIHEIIQTIEGIIKVFTGEVSPKDFNYYTAEFLRMVDNLIKKMKKIAANYSSRVSDSSGNADAEDKKAAESFIWALESFQMQTRGYSSSFAVDDFLRFR